MSVLSNRFAQTRADALGWKDWGLDEIEAVLTGSPRLLQSPDPTAGPAS